MTMQAMYIPHTNLVLLHNIAWPNCIAVVFQFTKLFSELKLLTDTLLFNHAEANREATESISHSVSEPSFYSQTPSYCYQTLP